VAHIVNQRADDGVAHLVADVLGVQLPRHLCVCLNHGFHRIIAVMPAVPTITIPATATLTTTAAAAATHVTVGAPAARF